ncbi:MAG: hypothetical protein ABT20_04700 [Rubrivivax sp. SCN 70-15]|nr:MAG: hypothetical protein ABT20_04700 [Rubrivivax sp. SCN 70-15]
MSLIPRWRRVFGAAALAAAASTGPAIAAVSPPGRTAPPVNSALDAPLLYQLLVGEIELRTGQPGAAYQTILDAARRTRDDALFRRAVDIALQAHAGDQALAAARAWRTANPHSVDALRLELQILAALNRMSEAVDPLRALIDLTPDVERGELITALPRFLGRSTDTRQTAQLLDKVLEPYTRRPALRAPAHVAMGRGWLTAGDGDRALALARQAQSDDPASPGAALLAIDLMPSKPQAEKIVTDYLARPGALTGLRLAYVRALTSLQRYPDAVAQLETVTREHPELAPPYLSLGALYLELRRTEQGDAALLHYVEMVQAQRADAARAAASAAASAASAPAAEELTATAEPADQGLVQAYLMLAQSAERRGNFAAADAWLARIDDPRRALEVQTRRASILARQGRIAEARALIDQVPERKPGDARAKLLAQASVLRDVKRWQDAFDVLASANQRFPDDTDLLYEQAMMAEKLGRYDEMERLLRRDIELKPDDAQANNALGYSLADRGVRLPEARQLIQRALELSPGDPFITDSLGWVEFRMGNRDEALRLLRQAYAARPDPEIAAHLGEVLWAFGDQAEARRVWQQARAVDAGNDVLQETLSRLKVGL